MSIQKKSVQPQKCNGCCHGHWRSGRRAIEMQGLWHTFLRSPQPHLTTNTLTSLKRHRMGCEQTCGRVTGSFPHALNSGWARGTSVGAHPCKDSPQGTQMGQPRVLAHTSHSSLVMKVVPFTFKRVPVRVVSSMANSLTNQRAFLRARWKGSDTKPKTLRTFFKVDEYLGEWMKNKVFLFFAFF